jgi:hypothetical protein
MQTSKTFTTPQGAKVSTRANKLYVVVATLGRGPDAEAKVILRTNDLPTAERRCRRERNSATTPYSFIFVFRKADGARLTDTLCGSYRPSDPMWVQP